MQGSSLRKWLGLDLRLSTAGCFTNHQTQPPKARQKIGLPVLRRQDGDDRWIGDGCWFIGLASWDGRRTEI